MGLVGAGPDPAIWLQAVAVGSLRLRPDQHYVIMRKGEKPARFLERGLKTYDVGVSPRQRWAGLTDEGVREAMHLVAFMIIAKELKNLAAGPAALGPAWPLMVGVDSFLTNAEKRALHAAGSDEKLQRALAEAIKTVLAAFGRAREADTLRETRAATWRRELPPGADVSGYFEGKLEKSAARPAESASEDIRDIEKKILRGPRPSFLPQDPEGPQAELPIRLKMLLPLGDASNDTFSKAIRAVASVKVV